MSKKESSYPSSIECLRWVEAVEEASAGTSYKPSRWEAYSPGCVVSIKNVALIPEYIQTGALVLFKEGMRGEIPYRGKQDWRKVEERLSKLRCKELEGHYHEAATHGHFWCPRKAVSSAVKTLFRTEELDHA